MAATRKHLFLIASILSIATAVSNTARGETQGLNLIYKVLDPQLLITYKDFDSTSEKALEGAFWAVPGNPESSNSFIGFTAQGNTFKWEGPSLASLRFTGKPVTNSPLIRRCVNEIDYTTSQFDADKYNWASNFNEGGQWIRSGGWYKDADGNNVLRGWYHTEAYGCYNANTPRHSISSMGYAESYDGGETFINMSNRPLFEVSDIPTFGQFNGMKAATVVDAGQYLYMFFTGKHTDGASRIFVARSNATDPVRAGITNTWTKWYNGRWVGANDPEYYGLFSPVFAGNIEEGNNNPGLMPAFNESHDSILLAWPQSNGVVYSEGSIPKGVNFHKAKDHLILAEDRLSAVMRTIPLIQYFSPVVSDYWLTAPTINNKWGIVQPHPAKYSPDYALKNTYVAANILQRAEHYDNNQTISLIDCKVLLTKKNGIARADHILRTSAEAQGSCLSTDDRSSTGRVLGYLWASDVYAEYAESVNAVGKNDEYLRSRLTPLYRIYSASTASYLAATDETIGIYGDDVTIDTILGYIPREPAPDLIRNLSIVGGNGGKGFHESFFLYYTLLERGDENYKRQYIRRKVVVSESDASRKYKARVSLASYKNQSIGDWRATTTLPGEGYDWDARLGYVYTMVDHGDPDLVSLYEAVSYNTTGKPNHYLIANEVGALEGHTTLRRLGFIYAAVSSNSTDNRRALYRCFDEDLKSFAHGNSYGCDLNNPRTSVLLGYISN